MKLSQSYLRLIIYIIKRYIVKYLNPVICSTTTKKIIYILTNDDILGFTLLDVMVLLGSSLLVSKEY